MHKSYLSIVLSVFFFIVTSTAFPQQKSNFLSDWKKVDQLKDSGLVKSALGEVEKIYQMAKKEDNQPQLIKSLLYKNYLSQNLEENDIINSINVFEKETAATTDPAAKSILQSITAQLYQNYLAFNRYKLYNVTNTSGFIKEDIATWTIDDLQHKTSSLYTESLQDKSTQHISLAGYDAIIIKGNSGQLRPTLYDLLAHRAIDYFESPENSINRPSYAFEINEAAAFAPAREFARHHFKSRDTVSFQLKALNIFQELIQLHINDTKALVDVDLERLNFALQNSVDPGKDSLYMQAVKLIYQNTNDSSAAEAGYLWARMTYNLASKDIDNKSSYSVTDAIIIIDDVVKKYPGSRGAKQAKNLLTDIQHPTLTAQTEKVNIPQKPFRALVSYKNLDGIYFRIIKVNEAIRNQIDQAKTDEEKFKKMAALPAVSQWQQELISDRDYLERRAEVKIDALPVGEYLLLTGKNKNFSTGGKNLMSANFFYVSNISYINSDRDYFVLNRETGAPIQAATVKIFRPVYNSNLRKYEYKHLATAKTNQQGYLRVPDTTTITNGGIRLDITTQNDHLYLDNTNYIYNYNKTPQPATQKEMDKKNARIFFFTDRSIYRPGQTVYYKGIGVTKGVESQKSQLLQSSDSFLVILRNAQSEIIDSNSVHLSDYGSFNGAFTLPQGGLNGNYSITIKDISGAVDFSVEEYKRPKFYTELQKIEATYRVNDTIRIKGKTEAYAGNPIDGAKVTYRVVRKTRFIYPWYFWRIGLPTVAPLEIAHGTTETDENGAYHIDFQAIPDLKTDPQTDPVFDYEIMVDVTDITGETRSASTTVPVGYKLLNLQIDIPDKKTFLSKQIEDIPLSLQNLSGMPQSAEVQLTVSRLKVDKTPYKERLWAAPNTIAMSPQDFKKYFPNDPFMDENKIETWEKIATELNDFDTVNGKKAFRLKKSLKSGWYKIEAFATDKLGNEVKDVKYFQVIETGKKGTPTNEYFSVVSNKDSFQPGDQASVYYSSQSDIQLYRQILKEGDQDSIPDFDIIHLNHQTQQLSLPVSEEDRGGMIVQYFFVKDNRFHTYQTKINVPWDNKKLQIDFETFRDKTLPGSKEEWKVKISGDKGQKVTAELLVGMYDASLDQFRPHSWNFGQLWPDFNSARSWSTSQNFISTWSDNRSFTPSYETIGNITYDQLGTKGAPLSSNRVYFRQGIPAMNVEVALMGSVKGLMAKSADTAAPVVEEMTTDESVSVQSSQTDDAHQNDQTAPPLRTNFNETAFFYPDLKTDAAGNVIFSFTMPEALTEWKLMAQAHTADLSTGYAEKQVVTQKDLMVVPNPPRFLREGDQIEFSAKVVNMTDSSLHAATTFHLLNASTDLPVDTWFKNVQTEKNISVLPHQSQFVSFLIDVPKGFNDIVKYRITARTQQMSDGEEAFLPVVTNRMLVTESLPLEMNEAGTKHFSFDKLLQSGQSSTLTNYGLTVEYTTNPAWYAVQALPYLNEYPYESAEQAFNRYFANALAMHITGSTPRLKQIFDQWRNADTSALLSNLQKNQELKSILLEETPWVMAAKNEAQQKENIALLFDLNKMSQQLDQAIQKVIERQLPNGGISWQTGGADNRYMTQYIIASIGHLKHLGAWPEKDKQQLAAIAQKGILYLDDRIREDYEALKKRKANLSSDQLSYIAAHYLYTRSFFPKIKINNRNKEAYDYYYGQAKKYWLQKNLYAQGLIALALNRNKDTGIAGQIVRSLKERAIVNDQLGMYWKALSHPGWWWYEAPIESQALMIEVFNEVARDISSVNLLKTWLLKNKQTNNWKTTKATAEAVYALLLQGTDWLSGDQSVHIQLGNTTIENKNEVQEAGTGYFSRMIDGSRVQPDMGDVSVTVTPPDNDIAKSTPSWGAVYWQYFEDLDKITTAETPLKLSRQLFTERNTDRGPVLYPVNDGDTPRVGDRLKVRIELRVDRDMEYIHMKDMRASASEPTNVLSQYKRQNGLGYYESTKDASTNFFFSYLPKGTYVFEYPVFLTHAGNFSNGITTIQSQYAPEFSAHSEGKRIVIQE